MSQDQEVLKKIADFEAGFEASVAHRGLDATLQAVLLDVKAAAEGELEVPSEGPYEAWMHALGKVVVRHGGSMAGFVARYNEVVSGTKVTTAEWFAKVDPDATGERLNPQFGKHLEEVAEMFPEITSDNAELDAKMLLLKTLLDEVGDEFKSGRAKLRVLNPKKFFDSLLDQNVTVTGVSISSGYNHAEGIARVDWANHTKFVDGVVLFKEGGTVKKGPYFWDPELTGLTG